MWAHNIPFSQDELKSMFRYDPVTGYLYRYNSSKPILWKSEKGYVRVTIGKATFPAHRIIWYMHTGEQPLMIDHINGIRDDNRIENLRSVNNRANLQNQYVHRQGKTCGIYRGHDTPNWCAHITIGNDKFHLGSYPTEAEASAAYHGACVVANALENELSDSRSQLARKDEGKELWIETTKRLAEACRYWLSANGTRPCDAWRFAVRKSCDALGLDWQAIGKDPDDAALREPDGRKGE